ncbi:MAG: hypothetical protein Q9225_000130 [Loekoesia sp. 1 TL-2023]
MAQASNADGKTVGSPSSANTFTYKPTVEAYNQWAATYDTDGNFMQALDSMMIPQMLPVVTHRLPFSPKLVDLGCGTGRNTLALLSVPSAMVLGLDNSGEMLNIARNRCHQKWESLSKNNRAATLSFEVWDIQSLQYEKSEVPRPAQHIDAVFSTLVLEHISLDIFFKACSMMLKGGGLLLLTNMHPDMGDKGSQAGFTDQATGQKIRPVSYIHTVFEVVQKARECGFEMIWGPKERAVHEDDLEKLGKRAERYVGTKVWFGIVLRKA